MTYLPRPQIEALIAGLTDGLPSLYQTVRPDDRQEAFAADANGILDLAAPEDREHAFQLLESLVIRTEGFARPLP